MEPLIAISTAFASIKTATEIAQLMRTSDTEFIEAEYKLRLANIMSSLADTKMSIADLKEIILEKDEKIKILESQLEGINEGIDAMSFQEGKYYRKGDEIPFCTRCYEKDGKKIHLKHLPEGIARFNGEWHCLVCKSQYK